MHRAFQQAIGKELNEPLNHFAYADWLEEHGDEKGARRYRASGLATQAYNLAILARDKQSHRNLGEGHEGEFKSWRGKYYSTTAARFPGDRYHRDASFNHQTAAEHHERLATYTNTPSEAKEHHLAVAKIHRYLEREHAAMAEEPSTTNNVSREDFERVISKEPNEPAHYLIYADYLEEHGEPRVSRAYRVSGMAVQAANLAHKASETYPTILPSRGDHTFQARFMSGEAKHLSERAAWKGNNYNNQAWHREASIWHNRAATAHERAAEISREEGVSEQPKVKEAIRLHQEAAKIHRRLQDEHERLAESTPSRTENNTMPTPLNPCGIEVVNESVVNNNTTSNTHYGTHHPWGAGEQTNEDTYDNEVSPNDEAEYLSQHAGDVSDWANKVGTAKAHQLASGAHKLASEAHEELAGSTSSSASIYHHNLAKIHEELATQAMIAGSPLGIEDVTPNPYGPQDLGGYDRRLADVHRIEGEPHIPGTVNKAGPKPGLRKRPRRRKPNIGVSVEPTLKGFEEAPLIEGTRNASNITNADRTYHANLYHPGEEVRVHAPHARSGEVGKVLSHDRKSGDVNVDFDGEPDVVSEDHLTHNELSSNAATFLEKAVEAAQQARDAASVPMIHEETKRSYYQPAAATESAWLATKRAEKNPTKNKQVLAGKMHEKAASVHSARAKALEAKSGLSDEQESHIYYHRLAAQHHITAAREHFKSLSQSVHNSIPHWTRVAREAAKDAKTAQLLTGKGGKESAAAMKASTKAWIARTEEAHHAALNEHKKASEAHEKAAAESSEPSHKEAHANAALAHWDAAIAHRKEMLAKGKEKVHNTGSLQRLAEEAAIATAKAHDYTRQVGGATNHAINAQEASNKAYRAAEGGDEGSKEAKKHHYKAAMSHRKAATLHEDIGRRTKVEQEQLAHFQAVRAHKEALQAHMRAFRHEQGTNNTTTNNVSKELEAASAAALSHSEGAVGAALHYGLKGPLTKAAYKAGVLSDRAYKNPTTANHIRALKAHINVSLGYAKGASLATHPKLKKLYSYLADQHGHAAAFHDTSRVLTQSQKRSNESVGRWQAVHGKNPFSANSGGRDYQDSFPPFQSFKESYPADKTAVLGKQMRAYYKTSAPRALHPSTPEWKALLLHTTALKASKRVKGSDIPLDHKETADLHNAAAVHYHALADKMSGSPLGDAYRAVAQSHRTAGVWHTFQSRSLAQQAKNPNYKNPSYYRALGRIPTKVANQDNLVPSKKPLQLHMGGKVVTDYQGNIVHKSDKPVLLRMRGMVVTDKDGNILYDHRKVVGNQSSPANDIVSSNGEQEYGVEDYLPQRQLSERDRRLGMLAKYELEELGNNPASWVKDEGKWEKAKAAASQQYKKSSKAFWPVVVSIYEKMGGKVRKHDKTENAVHASYKFPPDQVRFFGNALRGHYEKKAPEALTEGSPEYSALSSHYKAVRATNEAHKLGSAASHEAAAMSNAHASMNYADLASEAKNQLLKNAYTGLAYAHRRAANYHTLSSRITGNVHNSLLVDIRNRSKTNSFVQNDDDWVSPAPMSAARAARVKEELSKPTPKSISMTSATDKSTLTNPVKGRPSEENAAYHKNAIAFHYKLAKEAKNQGDIEAVRAHAARIRHHQTAVEFYNAKGSPKKQLGIVDKASKEGRIDPRTKVCIPAGGVSKLTGNSSNSSLILIVNASGEEMLKHLHEHHKLEIRIPNSTLRFTIYHGVTSKPGEEESHHYGVISPWTKLKYGRSPNKPAKYQKMTNEEAIHWLNQIGDLTNNSEESPIPEVRKVYEHSARYYTPIGQGTRGADIAADKSARVAEDTDDPLSHERAARVNIEAAKHHQMEAEDRLSTADESSKEGGRGGYTRDNRRAAKLHDRAAQARIRAAAEHKLRANEIRQRLKDTTKQSRVTSWWRRRTENTAENWTGPSRDAVTATRRAHYLTLKSLGIKPGQKVDVIDSPLFHSLEANRAASPYRQDVPTAALHKDAFESHREAARAHKVEAAKGGSNSKIHEAAMWGHVSAARAHRKALASLGDSEGSVGPKAGDLIKYRNPSLGERTGKIVAIDRKNDFALVRDNEGGQYSKIKRFSSAVKNHKIVVNADPLPYGVTPPEHPALATANLVGQKFKPILKRNFPLGERSPEYKEAFGKHLAATFASHLASKQNTPEAHLEAARKNNEAHNAFQSLKSVVPHLEQGLNAMAMAHKKLAAVHLPLAGGKPTGNIGLPTTDGHGKTVPHPDAAKDMSKTSQDLSQAAKRATRTAIETKRLKGSLGQSPVTYTRKAAGLAAHAQSRSSEGRWGSAAEGHSNAADAHFDAHNSLLKAWKHSGEEAYKKAADIHEKAAFSHLEAMHYIRRNMLALEGSYAKTNPKGTRNSAADIHQIPRRRKTNLLTSKATEMSLAAKDEDTHKSAHKAHKEAAKAHREAAEEIRKSPDHLMGEDYAMANHHEHMATWHDAKSVEHGVKGSVKA